jgi:hypothetical protein
MNDNLCPNGTICNAFSTCATPQYTVSNDTVTDDVTGLVWQRDVAPGGSVYTFDATGTSTTSAQYYCANLNLGGYQVGTWQVPSLNQLFTIVLAGGPANQPTIDQTAFLGTPYGASFRTSTEYQDASSAWTLTFQNGHASYGLGTFGCSLRCVH